jgi:hypothetical protein
LTWWRRLVKTVITIEEKSSIKAIALELMEIRKLIEEVAEKLVNLSDKKLIESFNATENDLKENKVLSYKETLEKQVDIAEKEFRS